MMEGITEEAAMIQEATEEEGIVAVEEVEVEEVIADVVEEEVEVEEVVEAVTVVVVEVVEVAEAHDPQYPIFLIIF